MAAPADRAPRPGSPGGLSRDEIAEALLGRRDALLRQLPRQIKVARFLDAHQREDVIDDAVDYLVTKNDRVIADRDALERAFWKVAANRVRHERDGRHNMIRRGWKRVSIDELEVPDSATSPEDAAIVRFQHSILIEFAAELTPEQQTVLSVKYLGRRELGRYEIGRLLGWSPHKVRSCERVIARRLKRFSAIVAAGSLCDDRQPAIEALAQQAASDTEYRVARAHLAHCQECRGSYLDLVRAIKSGLLQREIAQVLPAPALDAAARHRGPWEIVVDWCSRPFGHDAAISTAQLTSAGRGLGALAGTKLLALCLGGTAAVGGGVFCVSQLQRHPRPERPAVIVEKPRPSATPTRTPTPTVTVAATATPSAATKPTKSARPKKGGEVSRAGPRSHEKARAISPPVTAPDGSAVDEFEPGPATSAPRQPAAAPDSGGPEFF